MFDDRRLGGSSVDNANSFGNTHDPNGCSCKFGVLFASVRRIRALLLGVYILASDFRKLPNRDLRIGRQTS